MKARPDHLSALLADRGRTHGDFALQARIAQAIEAIMAMPESNWGSLSAPQREALGLIATKIGRILAGDPDHADHWRDIAGYAQLVADTLRQR